MMNEITFAGITISSWIIIPAFFICWVMILLLAKRIGFVYVRRFTRKTKTKIDDIFIKAADFPITLLVVTSGAAITERMIPHGSESGLTNYFLICFKATTILAIVLFIERFISGLVDQYAERIEILQSSGGIARGLIRTIVVSLGVLVLLDSFGVSVTPIIASLGIGSLAVALALQPTLENFFSGIQIVVDKPIQLGQFIKLESGEEGYVHKIGWRSTWVRLLTNNMVVIPNKLLVNAKIINYYYPNKELAVLVDVGVHYNSDLERVERVTIEVAKEAIMEVQGGVKSFEPFVRYHTLDDFSIKFTVILRAEEFVDQYLIKHEFIKRLQKRYLKEGIVIPYPIEAVNFSQEKAFEHPDRMYK